MSKEILSRFKKKMGFTPEIMSVISELDPKMAEFYKFCDFTIQEDGALPSKIKMLMIMAMGAQRHCEECVISAMRGAYNKGATEAEILEAIRVVAVGGGAPAIAACKDALHILKEKKFKKGSC
ncbi:MAG: carboxymuconolactone decarboxylase family protein [archaeon]|nr:carboxymuconolactone decarboxylase family protein [archaeon]MCP8314151.1 carboxymuconolactone decarboxylase family protein [archaeon]